MPLTRATWREVRPHVARLVPWPSLVGAIGAAALVGATSRRATSLHWTLVVMAAGIAGASVLDDAAAAVLAASPTSLRRRWAMRLVVALPVTAVSGGAGLWLVNRRGDVVGRGDAVLELCAGAAAALVLAAVALRRAPAAPAGAVAGPLLLALAAVVISLPGRLAVYPVATHRIGWALAIGLGAALVAALATDPAARRLSRAPGTAPRARPAVSAPRR